MKRLEPSLTDLVARWRERSEDLSDWPSFEAVMLADRAHLSRAWSTSDDAFSMALVLAGIHPEHDHEHDTTVALAGALSFVPVFERLAAAQIRHPPGSNFNGQSLFRLTRFVHGVRQALGEATSDEHLGLRLADAIRSVVPDICALEDHGEPAIRQTRDTDRGHPSLSCGIDVRLRHDRRAGGRIVSVAWNVRYRCWTYRVEGDPTRRAAEELLVS